MSQIDSALRPRLDIFNGSGMTATGAPTVIVDVDVIPLDDGGSFGRVTVVARVDSDAVLLDLSPQSARELARSLMQAASVADGSNRPPSPGSKSS